MTIKEKQSERKCKALRSMVESGEYSPAYALEKLEEYFDNGKVLERDYEPLAEWLEDLIDNPPVPEPTPEPEEEEEQEDDFDIEPDESEW